MTSLKKLKLRIRRSDSYVLAGLVHDVQTQFPGKTEEIAQLKEIIRDMCGGTDGSKMNAALFMPYFRGAFGKTRPGPLSIFSSELQGAINRLLRQEIKDESSIVSEYTLFIPSNYSVEDVEKLLNNQIENSELVNIFDYVQTISVGEGHTGNCYYANMYYAVNNNKRENYELQRIQKLIQSNCFNVIKSLNEISALPQF